MLTSILPMAQRYSNMNNSNIYLLFFIANYIRNVGKGGSFVEKRLYLHSKCIHLPPEY